MNTYPWIVVFAYMDWRARSATHRGGRFLHLRHVGCETFETACLVAANRRDVPTNADAVATVVEA